MEETESRQIESLISAGDFALTDQSLLESRIVQEAESSLREKVSATEQLKIQKISDKIKDASSKLESVREKLNSPGTFRSKTNLRNQEKALEKQLETLRKSLDDIAILRNTRETLIESATTETTRDRLIRTGQINPFSKMPANDEFLPNEDSDYEEDYADSQSDNAEDEEMEDGVDDDDDKYEDDGNEQVYQRRLQSWAHKRKEKRIQLAKKYNKEIEGADGNEDEEYIDEMYKDMGYREPSTIHEELGIKVPGEIWKKLFGYQRVGTQWLAELHAQKTGGIIGDEMGLGKTIQIIAFLAALAHSECLTGPILVICPATVLKQWVDEFHKWWPPFRVAILHSSGSGMSRSFDNDELNSDSDEEVGKGPRKRKLRGDDDEFIDYEFDDEMLEDRRGVKQRKGKNKVNKTSPQEKTRSAKSEKVSEQVQKLVDHIVENGHVIVTTYAAVRIHSTALLPIKWSYCVLDEGHKIRNPDADITLTCKQLKTLPVFQNQFSVPIKLGGYANANTIQVQTAYHCALALRDLVNPYLLRRMKTDVASDLPPKQEQVLFCRLTPYQKEKYKMFLKGDECTKILEGNRHALFGIDILRKICNHPDLISRMELQHLPEYGDPEKSGKMKVVHSLLKLWFGAHKVLLFCQTRQIQDILEKFVRSKGYEYRRMDGNTPIKSRIAMVDEFNSDPSIYVFLLTTKVGGLGINLTGADRIIIYDPDWNPSTDIQARERAWRIGQKKPVTIYRLMTSNTIEEKIYHRQIFKQFLTNKILKDPMQKRFFKNDSLHDLFSFTEDGETGETETGCLFKDVNAEITKDSVTGGDGVEVEGLDMIEEFNVGNNDPEGEKDTPAAGTSANADSKILQSLFSESGIHSVLQHDLIMDATKPEKVLIEKEAAKIANEALTVLRLDRKRLNAEREGRFEPTWTGVSGSVGNLDVSQPRFGKKSAAAGSSSTRSEVKFGGGQVSGFSALSRTQSNGAPFSSDILSSLSQRTVGSSSSSSNSAPMYPQHGEENTEHLGLLKRIVEFFKRQPEHQLEAEAIVEEFKDEVEGDMIPVFRQLLKGIATLERDDDARKIWVLKEDI
ncbi:hypothetical protein HK098_002942 [Nowakowskiella sp. JEL0407]|nr:hypothetical protein HK098_002942 [Nowakowskiella sp. JEL0407]